MRFDWYAATVQDDTTTVLDTLAADLCAEVVQGRALHGYERGYDLRREGSTVARALTGGRNGYPHVWASGDDTDSLVPVVRGRWPARHRVTRMDAAQDFDEPGAWDRLYAAALAVADERRLKIDQAGDWHRLEEGRTFYVGGRKSAVFARLYEKGKQLRLQALDGGADISPDLVRLEVQVRPEGRAREVAAIAAPEDAYGYAEWTRELARRVYGAEVERVHIKERRESDDERALAWLVRQYGEHLGRLAESVGSWERVGTHLGRMVERQERARGQG
jgi:DNA relaxase NicK